MASGNKIAITVSAVDEASARLEAINKRVAAMGAPVQRLQKSFGRLSAASGITKLSKGFTELGRGSLSAFRNVARVVDPLAAITGAASIAGMVKLTEAWADFGSQLGFTAQRLGITASALQTFQGGARLAGSSATSLASGMQTLGQNMYNAVGGRAPEVTAAFQFMHLSFQNVNGSARSVSEMLPEIADKIKGIADPFAQAAVATALFGGAGEDLLPFLRLGSAGIAKYNAEARRYGVMNAAGVTAANNMRMAQVGLALAVHGLGNSIAQRLAPVIDPLLNQMSEWIAANRDWIATGIGKAVQEFSAWLMAVNWQQVGGGVLSVAHGIGAVVHALGGWGKAARDLGIYWGVTWLASMLAPVVTITAALTKLIGLQRIAAFGPAGGIAAVAAASQVEAAAFVTAPMAAYTNSEINSARRLGATGGLLGAQGMAYFMSQGWSAAQAAGIMSNVGSESSFNPRADSVDKNTGLHHRGLFQWDPTRWAALTKWAKTNNPSAAQQFQFAQSELMGNESRAGAMLRATSTPGAAGVAFDNGFERSGDTPDQQRVRGLNAYAFDMSPSGAPANIGDGSAAGGAGAGGPVKVQVDVTHTNPPPGTSVAVSSKSPGAYTGEVKIVRAMPEGGL